MGISTIVIRNSIVFRQFRFLCLISSFLIIVVQLTCAQYIGIITAGIGNPKPIRLKEMNVYTDKISLSGYSSGAGIAQQLQISYSSLFSGIAIFGQTFYRCGPGDGIQSSFDTFCTNLGNLMPEHQWEARLGLEEVDYYYLEGLIENPRYLQDKKLYIFASTHNYLFSTDQQLRVHEFYRPLIRNEKSIKVQFWPANHTLPSNHFGGPCVEQSESLDYFIGYCGIPGAFEALRFLHGKSWVPYYPKEKQRVSLQPLLTFDQTEFFYGVKGEHTMDNIGFIYIPKKCKRSKCLLHFYFHGCRSGREFLGDNHIRHSGYLEVAELNNIIMVFPQALKNDGENQIGCWDTYGFTGPLFATRKGAQVTVIRNMLARILGDDKTKMFSTLPGLKIPFIPKWEIMFPANVNVKKV